jgi:hypothetical protein
MNSYRSCAAVVIVGILAAADASAATITTLSSDFESPEFTVGLVGGNPPYTAGQGGWGGYNGVIENSQLISARIVDDRAHTGTQSLHTVNDTRLLQKALDADGIGNPSSGGEYPAHSGGFSINAARDWWVQAYVWINPGKRVRMALVNGLGGCPLLDIGNFGTGADPGEPYANTCLANSGNQANLGSGVYGQWLLLEMVHTTTMGQAMEFRISGTGIDYSISLSPYSGPGSGSPAYLGLTGDAWWDDVRAGYGDAPSPVPLPGAGWLMASALGVLARHARRR